MQTPILTPDVSTYLGPLAVHKDNDGEPKQQRDNACRTQRHRSVFGQRRISLLHCFGFLWGFVVGVGVVRLFFFSEFQDIFNFDLILIRF